VFPSVVDADKDGRKDLLIGQAEGNLKLYLNVNTDDDPEFDGGTLLQVGPPGSKIDIDVGQRPTISVADWNNDGRRDIVVGAKDGYVRLFVNEGTDAAWDFRTVQYVQEDGANMLVPTLRASPFVMDLDDDGMKDILMGNTEGQLLFYSNVGSDDAPTFSGYTYVEADGTPIDLAGIPRSRPFVCDWNNDGSLDVLLGAGDGLVRLYPGVVQATDVPGNELPPNADVARLLPAYPNPFNPAVTIPFVLPGNTHVKISIYNIEGRLIAEPAAGIFPKGTNRVTWQGTDDAGRILPSGMYFVRLLAGGISLTEKIVLVR
jgi:hypothetical protein